MAHLKIKGYPNLIEVDDKEAKDFRDNRPTDPHQQIQIGVFSGENHNVTAIILTEERRENTAWAKNNQEWEDYRRKMLALTPEQKAVVSLSLFELMFWSLTDQRPDEDLKQRAISSASAFFALAEGGDKRILPDPSVWKEIIRPHTKGESFISEKHTHAFKIIERSVAQDIEDSKNVFINPTKSKNSSREEETNSTDEIGWQDL